MPEPVTTAATVAATATAADWILPAVKAALEHPDDIAGFWQKLIARVRGKKSTLVFTGYSGVGKTVLYDHLRGAAPKAGYRPSGQSIRPEKGGVVSAKNVWHYMWYQVKHREYDFDILDELFNGKHHVDGVIHTVCYGYAEFREVEAASYVKEDTDITLEHWLEAQRKAELEELKEVGRYIASSYRKNHSPKWLILALTKYDLYYDKHEAAIQYYVTDQNSEFVQEMNDIVQQVGQGNFQWSIVPVSTYLDHYNWPKGNPIAPQFAEPERDHFLSKFLKKLQDYCE